MPKPDTGEAVHVEFDGEASEEDVEKAKAKVKDVAEQKATVVLIHKPTGKNTYGRVKVRDVRRYAEKAVKKFRDVQPDFQSGTVQLGDFYVVEVHDSGKVNVTTLE